MLDGIYRSTGDEALFQEACAPTRAELQGLLVKIIARLMKMLTRQGYFVEEQGMTYLADRDSDNSERPPSGMPTVSFGSIPAVQYRETISYHHTAAMFRVWRSCLKSSTLQSGRPPPPYSILIFAARTIFSFDFSSARM